MKQRKADEMNHPSPLEGRDILEWPEQHPPAAEGKFEAVERRLEELRFGLLEQHHRHIKAVNHLYWRSTRPEHQLTEEDLSLGISYKYAPSEVLWACAARENLEPQECEKLVAAAAISGGLIGPNGQSLLECWLKIAHEMMIDNFRLEGVLRPLQVAEILFEAGAGELRRLECYNLCCDIVMSLAFGGQHRNHPEEWELITALRDKIMRC